MNERLFLSCVSDEFEKENARFPGFRSLLAGYLRRADCHLTRARIVGSWTGELGSLKVDAKAELAEARRLIEKHKYGRRIPELEDAEKAGSEPQPKSLMSSGSSQSTITLGGGNTQPGVARP